MKLQSFISLKAAALLKPRTETSASCSAPAAPSLQTLAEHTWETEKKQSWGQPPHGLAFPLYTLDPQPAANPNPSWIPKPGRAQLTPSVVQVACECLTHLLPFIEWAFPAANYSAQEALVLAELVTQ